MFALELTLLGTAYTVIVLTLFLEVICYFRHLESRETIAFTVSLLLLIMALTSSYFLESNDTEENTSIFTLLAMTLVGLTTPLNIFEERYHQLSPHLIKWIVGFSILLMLAVVLGHFLRILDLLQYVVVVFLGSSVIGSMILLRTTKPRVHIAHREKLDRYISMTFLIFVPLTLAANYIAELYEIKTKIGFTLPVVFIILAASKMSEDMQRLSLFKPENTINQQTLKNYALSKREKEVALLLIKGTTYHQIAEQLFVSLPTVKSHVTNIYTKCKANNRAELISLLSHR